MLQAVDARTNGAYQRLSAWHTELTAFRRDLHAHPELGYEEVRTGGRVVEALKLFGVDEVHTGIGKTGIVGVIHGQESAPPDAKTKSIGLRADYLNRYYADISYTAYNHNAKYDVMHDRDNYSFVVGVNF